jgi:hypothetical protein
VRLKATVAGALDGTAKVECTLAGTGTIATSGTTAATGTNTKFLTEYAIGDVIMVGTETSRVVATVPSDTSLTVTVAFSNTAGTLAHWINYGGTTKRIAITAGAWNDVVLSDGERMGANYPHARVQFMFTSGGVFTLNDEWACAQQAGKSVVTFVQKQPLTAVGCKLTIGGAEVEVEGLTINLDAPRLAYFSVGDASARRVIDNGQRMAEVAIKRMYLDRTFLRLARNGAKVAVLAEARGNRFGTTAFYEGWTVSMPNVQFNEAGASGIKDTTAFEEEVKGIAYFDPATPTVAPVVETLITSVATLK